MSELKPVKVGEIIRVIQNRSNHAFEIGEKVRVTRVYNTKKERVKAEHLDGRDFWWLHDDEFALVSGETYV